MPPIRALTAAAVVLTGALAGCGGEDPKSDDLGGAWTATLAVTTAWSEIAPRATGTADVSSTGSTSVRLAVTGLAPGTEYMSHVHDGGCDEDPPGGGHWLADPDGEDAAGNIIELSFTTSDTGVGSATVSSDLILDERARSVVVHAPEALTSSEGADADRVLCGNLDAD
ncbi:hypothetical protein O1R50_00200 [Glycomyces luteolus]|uniref:Superoxide dismutase family protein n=1 Tax=Glycomyces luteolus TaxID=2670330 RepID=A0A9X3P8V1_9ACTN|nr:hypothetical protein [Glycomyces luteolus]MDA1358024.1 hypothetical protein [Glycomyces luteolus]